MQAFQIFNIYWLERVQNKKKSEYLQNQLIRMPSTTSREASSNGGAAASPSNCKKVNILLQVPNQRTLWCIRIPN
jgi:hypothetical protein